LRGKEGVAGVPGLRRALQLRLKGSGRCAAARHPRRLNDRGARRSNLEELTDWTLWADKVVTF
jgi:sulfur relay (sulfurtransferase) complex TusBCD TusD component (DsrE family)